MSSFTLFRRGECPICGGALKGCRQSKDTGLVFCRDSGANPTDYIYRGSDVWGFGLWQSKTDAVAFSHSAKEQREQRRQEFLKHQQQRRQQRLRRQLPAVSRDKWYRQLLEKLHLSDSDRSLLLARGFTHSQIEKDCYRSIAAWQKVGIGYPTNLPGILTSGFGSEQILNVPGDGILCPIRNTDGLIVGCQIRLHDSTDGRYRWLTSATKRNPEGATSHLNGELPLGVFEPDDFLGDSIWLTEGTTIKPSITRYRLGVPVIGAASGRFDGSPELSVGALEYLAAKYQTKLLTFAVDAGDVVNRSGVPERWQYQIEFFEQLGYTCRVAWWGQVTKDADDIDELDDTSVINYITPEDFCTIVWEHRENKPSSQLSIDNSIDLPDSFRWAWEQWLNKRKFTPDVIVKQAEFSFGDIPDAGVIVAVKSGLGTGKTKALINQIKLGEKRGKGAIIIGYRNNLLLQTGSRAEKSNLSLYHIHQDDDAKFMIADDTSHHMMCLDSIHHIDGYFKGRDIYLDETCSVLLHAVTGGTLGDEQAKALRILTKALNDCNRIFLLDGNLADIYVDFIALIAANKRVIKIENRLRIPANNITFIDGIDSDGEIKKRDRSPLIKFLLKSDVKPWIFSDSKERTKVLYKLLSDNGRTGYVLNSETAGEQWAKEFLADPDEFIREKKPEFIILSPSGDSGLSCTEYGYFTTKLTFFSGVLRTNSQHQAMFRLRDNTIPHYVFCPEFSTLRTKSTPRTYIENRLKQILYEQIDLSALIACSCADNPEKAREVIADAIKRQDDRWWDFSAQLACLDNFEIDNYRACLIHALTEAGHNVNIENWETATEVKSAEKQALVSVQKQHAQETFKVVEFPSIEEANQKAKSNNLNLETQRRIEKTRLLDRLPGIQNSEIWSPDFIYHCHIKNREFIKQQERYWLLKNYEVSQKRHESIWNYLATNEDFFSRQVSAMGHDVIWALRELNILSFIDEREYHKDSPEVMTLISTLRQRRDIQLALRINKLEPETEQGKERLRILNGLLNLIGYKTKFTRKPRIKTDIGTIRMRFYAIVPSATDDKRDTPPSIDINKPGCVPLPQLNQDDQWDTPPSIDINKPGCVPLPQLNQDDQWDTPPSIDINKPGYVPPMKSTAAVASRQFDMRSARQAILAAVERRFTNWSKRDRAKVSWSVEETAIALTSTPFPVNIEQPGYGHSSNPVNSQIASPQSEILNDSCQELVKGFAQLVVEGLTYGVETVKELLKPLTMDLRWAVALELGDSDPDKFNCFAELMPDWVEFCNAGTA